MKITDHPVHEITAIYMDDRRVWPPNVARWPADVTVDTPRKLEKRP